MTKRNFHFEFHRLKQELFLEGKRPFDFKYAVAPATHMDIRLVLEPWESPVSFCGFDLFVSKTCPENEIHVGQFDMYGRFQVEHIFKLNGAKDGQV